MILGSRGVKGKQCGTSACSSDLCIPGSAHRLEEDGGPCHKACVLGIESNTVDGVMKLSSEKIQLLQLDIQKWMEWKSTTKQELLSLIGHF